MLNLADGVETIKFFSYSEHASIITVNTIEKRKVCSQYFKLGYACSKSVINLWPREMFSLKRLEHPTNYATTFGLHYRQKNLITAYS